jgi:hypothetical protein
MIRQEKIGFSLYKRGHDLIQRGKKHMSKVKPRARGVRNAGYTIDQTILIIAIIAILITIVIATVGWDLINRAGGAKLAAQFRQVEDAVGQFFATHSMWPHQAINGVTVPIDATEAGQVMYALTGDPGINWVSSIDTTKLRNHVTGFAVSNPTAGVTARLLDHDFGGNADSTIRMFMGAPAASTGLSGNSYLIVQFNNVPAPETLEADEAIDGSLESQIGRVFYREDGTNCATAGGQAGAHNTQAEKDTVCYAANLVQ